MVARDRPRLPPRAGRLLGGRVRLAGAGGGARPAPALPCPARRPRDPLRARPGRRACRARPAAGPQPRLAGLLLALREGHPAARRPRRARRRPRRRIRRGGARHAGRPRAAGTSRPSRSPSSTRGNCGRSSAPIGPRRQAEGPAAYGRGRAGLVQSTNPCSVVRDGARSLASTSVLARTHAHSSALGQHPVDLLPVLVHHQAAVDANPRLVVAVVGRPVAGNRNDGKAWELSGAEAAVGRTTVIVDDGYRGSGQVMSRRREKGQAQHGKGHLRARAYWSPVSAAGDGSRNTGRDSLSRSTPSRTPGCRD